MPAPQVLKETAGRSGDGSLVRADPLADLAPAADQSLIPRRRGGR